MEEFIKDTIKQAGKSLLQRFGKLSVKYTKSGITDVVTEADLVANKIIINAIKKKYPDHGIISEETGNYQLDARYIWVIDPLDGTRNFVYRSQRFYTMIGLTENWQVKMSAVYHPPSNEMFFAEQGKGAYLNNKKIQCSQLKRFEGSWGSQDILISQKNIKLINKILRSNKNSFMSAVLSTDVNSVDVATGRRDWYFSKGAGVWDYAAPSLIMKEAGLEVTNFAGKDWSLKDNEIVAANKYLHPKLLSLLNI